MKDIGLETRYTWAEYVLTFTIYLTLPAAPDGCVT